MIFGVCSKESLKFKQLYQEKFKREADFQSKVSDKFGFVYFPENINTDQKKYSGVWQDKKNRSWFLFQGHIFNEKQLQEKYGLEGSAPFSQLISKMFATDGTKGFRDLNGHFAVAMYDENNERLVLVRDHFGVEPLYFFIDNSKIVFVSNPLFLLKHHFIPKEINHKGLYTYFLFNYLPTSETIIAHLTKVRPSFAVEWKNGNVSANRYWYLSFKQKNGHDETFYKENTLRLLKDAVKIRLENKGKKTGAFLSGGMDSSSVVGLSGPNLENKMSTFSFRCKGETFDESHYAEFMSEAYGTDHHLVEFPHEATRSIIDLVEIMPEPFCDIGIEIASFLLAKFASGKVDYILSGDGGDELFAGHPVYIADHVAKYFDLIPDFIQKPIINLLQLLPDTDKKKSLPVKAKRFSYSFNFPASLFSNRWRIYYTPKELQESLAPALWQQIKDHDPLPEIKSYYTEADGEDFLSKTLYGDYATVVNFYLTRMSVLRHFGIEAKFPMFDYRLVEFAAGMPSDLKIKGNNDTKYILKKTMTGVLPDEIVFRKDKLGHSVPMKNWMRDSSVIISLINEILSEENVKKRGFFKPVFVQKMIADHQAKKVNHSHRIWALMVLELWLQKHFD